MSNPIERLSDRCFDFAAIGRDSAMEAGLARCGSAGWGEACLTPLRALIDHAAYWMQVNR